MESLTPPTHLVKNPARRRPSQATRTRSAMPSLVTLPHCPTKTAWKCDTVRQCSSSSSSSLQRGQPVPNQIHEIAPSLRCRWRNNHVVVSSDGMSILPKMIERHRTALQRSDLSRPVKRAINDGL